MLYVLLGLSCTRLINVYGTCESNAECIQALGDGAICLDDGYCSLGGLAVDTSDETTEDTGDTGDGTSVDTADTGDTGVEESCTTHKECRGENGLGSLCGDDGTCSQPDVVEMPSRCTTYPDGAFESWSEYSDAHILGAIVDARLEKPTQLTLKLAMNEINESLGSTQFVMFICDNQSDLWNGLHGDNLTSQQATEQLSDFLTNELHVPVIMGPGKSDLVQPTIEAGESTSDSSTIVVSTAGGDGLTELGSESGTSSWLLTNPGKVWSAVGDDYHRLLTLHSYFNDKESYGSAVILTDKVDLVTCAPGRTGAILSGCQFGDPNDLWTPDDAQYLLDLPGSSIVDVHIYPYSNVETAYSQLWYDYLSANVSSGTAILFLSDDIDTNSDFISRVVPSVAVFQNSAFYFSEAALQTSFIDAISPQTQTRFFIRGFSPGFDENGSLFNAPSSGFYQRLYDSTNGMDASENPQSIFTYDAIMLTFLAILHSEQAGDKGDGIDISKMLRTFKTFNNVSTGGDEFTLTTAGIQSALAMNPQDFRLLGLSGEIRQTSNQDASVSSFIWELNNGEVEYKYRCFNTLSTAQDTLDGCIVQ